MRRKIAAIILEFNKKYEWISPGCPGRPAWRPV